MRCPTCGHSNSDLATRCSACGAMLPQEAEAQNVLAQNAPQDAEATGSIAATDAAEDTARQTIPPFLSRSHTQEQPLPSAPPSPDKEPEAREVAHAARRLVVSKQRRLGGFLRSHERAFGIGLAAVVVGILVVVWLMLNVTNAPSYEQIEQDIRELLPTYEYHGGAYGTDLTMEVSKVSVTKRDGTRTPEGMEAAGGVGATAFAVETELVYESDSIRVVRDMGSTYVRTEDGWAMVGDLADFGTSLEPKSGVNQDKVVANIDAILEAVGAQDGVTLNDMYAYGDFYVSGSDFQANPDHDTSTDDVVIHCTKQSDFYTYEGNVTAHFAFESGEWQLRSAEKDANATTRSYTALVGTWSGGMVGHEALGASCYGAQNQPLVVHIESVGDSSGGSGQVQGTVTTLVHYHDRLTTDAESTQGDTTLEDVAFSGSISTDYDEELGSSLVVSCTTLGSPDGDMSFKLGFGTDTDPSSVVARVTSTHDYEEMVWLFVPHQTTAKFTDTFLLGRI